MREYAQSLSSYRTGALDSVALRNARIQAGIHLQRAARGRYMIRVKIPYGLADPPHIRALATACRHGRG